MPSEDTQFKPGNPGGPGRPKGRSNAEKLRQALLDGMEDTGDWLDASLQKDGKGTGKRGSEAFVIALLREAATKEPVNVLRIMVSLIPKEFKAQIGPDVDSVIRLVREMDRVTAPGEGSDDTDGGSTPT